MCKMEMKEPDLKFFGVFDNYNNSLMARYLIINNWHWISKLVILLRQADVVKFTRARD